MRFSKKSIINIFTIIFVNVAILDPSGIFINIKAPLFCVLIFLLFITYPISKKYIKNITTILTIFIITVGTGLIMKFNFDFSYTKQFLTTFLSLSLLLWYKQLKIYNYLLVPSLILSTLTIFLYIVFVFYPDISKAYYVYIAELGDVPQVFIDEREFLGISFQTIFYTPIMINVVTLPICLYHYLSDKKKSNLILSIILTLGLFCAGNRACLLSLVLIYALIIAQTMWQYKKMRIILRFLFLICGIFFIVLLSNVILEKEESNVVKAGHIQSYITLLKENPCTFIIGSGAGSLFYSKGFHKMTALTEITYIEIFRTYGILGALYIMMFFLFPAYKLIRNKRYYHEYYPQAVGLIMYILSSSMNPYLFTSTGMIVIISLYQYINNEKQILNKSINSITI